MINGSNPELRFTIRGDGERHEGYSFDRPDGSRCEVPAETIYPTRYQNLPMSRDEAYDVVIAFGLEYGMPVRVIPNGAGYDLAVPAEYHQDLLMSIGRLPL